METNCTVQQMQNIRFGYAFLGNHRTMKLRFKYNMASFIMQRLPKHFHNQMQVFVKMNRDYVTLACVAHQQSAIWPALEIAIKLAKVDELRYQANFQESLVQLNMFAKSA